MVVVRVGGIGALRFSASVSSGGVIVHCGACLRAIGGTVGGVVVVRVGGIGALCLTISGSGSCMVVLRWSYLTRCRIDGVLRALTHNRVCRSTAFKPDTML